ncbi:ATP-grasp fold amidoligase family protein [Desulfonatronum parangueonense]
MFIVENNCSEKIENNFKIYAIKDKKSMSSFDNLIVEIDSILNKNIIKKDRWIVEEYITLSGQPANDLKFYCFYGEVALVRERRQSDLKSCWYNDAGAIVDAGIYEQYKGNGIDVDFIQIAANISKQIPLPSIRIDFLKQEFSRSHLDFLK